MNTKQQLEAAIKARHEAEDKIAKLEKQLRFENSFGTPTKVYIVTRRDISTGRLLSMEAGFEASAEANRYACGQYAWEEAGLGVEALDFYSGKV